MNGDFSAGNTGFQSQYAYVNPGANPNGNNPGYDYTDGDPFNGPKSGSWYAGTYTIDSNPNNDHVAWSSFTNLPAGSASGTQMMIVNGASSDAIPGTPSPPNGTNAANEVVWQRTFNVTTSGLFDFSAWATSLYSASPANLSFVISGPGVSTVGYAPPLPWTLSQPVSDWANFNAYFTAVTGTVTVTAITDLNAESNGNDFALTDL